MRGTRIRRTVLASLAATALLGTAACGGSSSGSGGGDGGVADEIKVVAVRDHTGPVAYAGLGGAKGTELAVEEINSSGFLGDGVKLVVDEVDSAGEIERASSEMTKAMSDRDVMAILGPTQGAQAASVAPLVERQKVPTIFTQSGSEGVVIGDWTFRATAPMQSYYDIAMKKLADDGVKKVSVLYNATFATFAELGEDVVPELAEENGIEIVSSDSVQSTTQDFTGQTQSIAKSDPDAVVMLLIAPQSVTALGQLRQAGYDKQVMATSVQAAGNVSAAGAAANGLMYPVDYSTAMDHPEAQAFATAFQEKFGEEPDPYAAEGYDGTWWLARAIKASGDSSREGIQEGLTQVAEEGFTGAMGDITFEGNDMRVTGVVVQWDGTTESLTD